METGAARIKIENAVLPFLHRLRRVAANHRREFFGAGVEVQILHAVGHHNGRSLKFARPISDIRIAADRCRRR
jgi:hypothetical protein